MDQSILYISRSWPSRVPYKGASPKSVAGIPEIMQTREINNGYLGSLVTCYSGKVLGHTFPPCAKLPAGGMLWLWSKNRNQKPLALENGCAFFLGGYPVG